MKIHTHIPLFLIILIALGAGGLAACGSDATPAVIYVTPTPDASAQAQATQAAPQVVAQASSPSPTATALPPTDPPPSVTPLPSYTPAPSDTPGYIITPQPTPAINPNATYGAIIGPDYTPEALYTPLPEHISQKPCPAIVRVPQVDLYASPDATSNVVGQATEANRLIVNELFTDPSGNRWANTPQGWLMLVNDGVELAALDSMRTCEILLGQQQPTTLLGLHVLNGESQDQILALVQRLVDDGHPMSTIKGLNGAEDTLRKVKQISPETVTVFRSLYNNGNLLDCPADIFDLPDPVSTAQRWIAGYQSYWDQIDADYYEYMNECPAPLDWIAQFSIEAMRIANGQGRCLLLFSFPGGNPQPSVFNELLPAYKYAAENPCQPGRTHGIALHAYSLEDNVLVSESNVWVALRHRIFHETLLQELPEAANLPVYITELGEGGGQATPNCDQIIRDALQYTYELEEDPYVKGFHLWSVGGGTRWTDLTPCLPALGDALIAYYSGS